VKSLLLTSVFLLVTMAACNPSSTKSGITNDTPPPQASSTPTSSTSTPTSTSTASTASTPTNSGPHPKIVEATADADTLTLIRTQRLQAKADSRVLVVYVSATWCEPCKKFKKELDSGRLDDRLAKITFLAFDADKDMDRLGSAGYKFKFVPFVALPGVDGQPSDSQQATGKGGDAWRELLGKLDAWQSK
jgi:thiol-disulfide isomerase/thioredoxin